MGGAEPVPLGGWRDWDGPGKTKACFPRNGTASANPAPTTAGNAPANACPLARIARRDKIRNSKGRLKENRIAALRICLPEVQATYRQDRKYERPHLKKCPHCGGKVESVITAPAIQFKGSGLYVTITQENVRGFEQAGQE